ncbi:carboxypeptidase regulatory-like domain-containing protein [Maribacter algarum]|uniref:Carboxypeptidase regulatory-like domain-containing protein n=1 Tax=Maribacter algarum (ex Zhang et al. 2020) TaxID=2578118 RepID=A0A5S3PPP9_9FLAO|nr:carboxypeptidase-like regulatory domain-containing protein [Maribacter algarum]TMM56651.1 carboxypeptidase regulatory-like domain-containing protein [Maribacter algarum]
MLDGIIFDSDSGLPVENAKVTIFCLKNKKVFETCSDENGAFDLDVNCEENIYKIIVFKEGYHFSYTLIESKDKPVRSSLEIALRKRK